MANCERPVSTTGVAVPEMEKRAAWVTAGKLKASRVQMVFMGEGKLDNSCA